MREGKKTFAQKYQKIAIISQLEAKNLFLVRIVKLQVQGPNLELTLLSHCNNNNNNNKKKNKNPHLKFLIEW